MEWGSLVFPIIGALILKFYFHQKVVWWELVIPMIPVIILTPLIKLSDETIQTIDHERRSFYITEARYYEDWNEYVHQICTRQVSCGKNCTTTEVYDCSYVAYHAAYWEVEDNIGNVHYVTQDFYQSLVKKFGNESFIDLHRHYYTNDGDMYVTRWRKNDEAFQTWFTLNSYTNRVQATPTTFSYPKINNPKELGLYDWPNKLHSSTYDPAILGKHKDLQAADLLLQKYNCKLGVVKQVRMWILLYENKPRSVAFDQESYWVGGNKNEFVVCIGLDKNKVTWCNAFCWSPDGNTSNDELKVSVRDFVEKQKDLDLIKTVDYVADQVRQKFKRKSFKEFSYISIPESTTALIVTYVLALLATIGCCIFAVKNEVNNEERNCKSLT